MWGGGQQVWVEWPELHFVQSFEQAPWWLPLELSHKSGEAKAPWGQCSAGDGEAPLAGAGET